MKKNSNIFFKIINFCIFINCLYYMYLYCGTKQNIGGFYYNSNDLGTVIILAAVISIYMIVREKNITNRIIQIVFLCSYIFSFIKIWSRGCILGVAFAIIILLGVKFIKNRKKIMKKKNIAIPILVIVSISIIFLGIKFYSKYIGNISFKPVDNAQRSNDVRVNLIFNGLYFLSQDANIITGIGAGNTIYYLKNYSIYSLHKTYSFHNFWLEILVEYGIIIFISFIIEYVLMLKGLYVNSSKKERYKDMVFIFFWLTFILASISSSTMLTREWLWLVFAFTISYINRSKSGNNE